ncbi:cation diffusion facilitator family transporter [Leptolyngbya ohadii]|uniref:cation diffusion facilitator family transporter n=1 Tax=Leptolyngbya ohadii TaxID=1962290 RepID=UPI000B59B87A|nr:cation diffusion facilitator family transporter [Leptolyngbya ohadii]
MVLQSPFDRTQESVPVHSPDRRSDRRSPSVQESNSHDHHQVHHQSDSHSHHSYSHHFHSHHHGHSHGHDHEGHAHTHGVIDPGIVTTDRGLWAVKWSFVGLMVTALLQVGVVVLSGSVALLADTIHNFADAATAIPLGLAFLLARRPPTARFAYGYGRVEDLAGVVIVAIICFSALITGYESIDRFFHPQTMQQVGFVVLAAVIGFLGNEWVARFRIRVGQEINSAALVADGYHARIDSLTSLAVLGSAVGTWLGFPIADPLIGLGITIAIIKIVIESAQAVFTRLLDGADPELTHEIHHAVDHVEGISVQKIRSRWIGHQLQVHLQLKVQGDVSIAESQLLTQSVRKELQHHLPYVKEAIVELEPKD